MNISALQNFYCGFYLTSCEGNNAFCYDKRTTKKIYVPPLIRGALEDVRTGEEVVFSEGGIDAIGLKDLVHIDRSGQDIFIFDNHNHAFSFWAAGIQAGVIEKGSMLVHVDQHKDTRSPEQFFDGRDACHYANHVLNVGNFILPALKLGWFAKVVHVGSAEAFDTPAVPGTATVLDIDLDIFDPIMDHIPEEIKIARLRQWISQARFITIATSPFFMDQERALHYLRLLL